MNFHREILAESLDQLHFALRFFSHLAIFNEILDRKMSKSPNISPENYPCDKMLHYVAFHLGLPCLPMQPFRGFSSSMS